MKLLTMQSSPASCHLLPLRSKHSSQHQRKPRYISKWSASLIWSARLSIKTNWEMLNFPETHSLMLQFY
jgi:hypothetical protein